MTCLKKKKKNDLLKKRKKRMTCLDCSKGVVSQSPIPNQATWVGVVLRESDWHLSP